MRIWVDCTAAAHPLVLRPIIERLEARGDEVFVTAREYGQTVGMLDRLGIPYTVVGEHGGASKLGKVRALAALGGAREAGLEAAAGTGDRRTGRSTSPSSRRCSGSPRRRCRTTSSPACSGRSPSGAARRVLVPETIPLDRLRRIGAKREKLVRYPGLKEEYYLADFEPDAAVARRARARPREGARRRPPAAGDLRVPRPQRPLRPDDPPPGRGAPARRRPSSSPAPRRQASRGAGARRRRT